MIDTDGFMKKWIPGSPVTVEEGRWLLIDIASATRFVNPMEREGLVFEFAALEQCPNSVAAFASEWGTLGVSDKWSTGGSWNGYQTEEPSNGLIEKAWTEDLDEVEGRNPLEHVEAWYYEIRRIKAAVEMWEELSDPTANAKKIASRLHRDESGWTGIVLADGWATRDEMTTELQKGIQVDVGAVDVRVTEGVHLDELDGIFNPGGQPVAVFAVRAGLRKMVSTMIRGNTYTDFQARYDVEGRQREMLVAVPRSLLGALWIQLAQSMEFGNELRRCPIDSKAFTVDPRDARQAKREYCSDDCRHKAYRRRKARVIEEIAFGTNLETAALNNCVSVEKAEGWLVQIGDDLDLGKSESEIAKSMNLKLNVVKSMADRRRGK